VRRDGFPAILLLFVAPFAALGFGILAHPLALLDDETAIRGRVEGWRPEAARAAEAAGVPVELLLGLVAAESKGRAAAVSDAGAVGLAQLMKGTADEMALEGGGRGTPDLRDPETNLRLGATYLARQLRTFGGDEVLALAAYHSGPGTVQGWRDAEPGAPGPSLLEARGTSRTRAYVARVLRWRDRFRGSGDVRK